MRLGTVSMDFAYKTYFKMACNTGYETLIYDCMIGDATLFQRADNVEGGWRVVQPILDAWADDPPRDFPNYVAGGSGPRRPTTCWRAMVAPGGRWMSGRRGGPDARKRKISLVLADVDGTLVTEEKVLTQRAQSAVRALRNAGIRFAITSGRPPLGMAMLFDALELDTPIAGFNGGLFVERDLTILAQKTVPADVARQALDLIREHGLDAWVYCGNDWLITKPGAPRRARGVDGQVRAKGRARFRRRAGSGRQDRRRQRRSRPGPALRG